MANYALQPTQGGALVCNPHLSPGVVELALGRLRAMTLSYILGQAGWATVTISHDTQRLEMNASYLSDSLPEMTQAAICLLEGADSVRFFFEDEPGEHRCIVCRTGDSEAKIRILWFDDCAGFPDERGSEVFFCTCSIARFCGEVLACLQRLLDEHGVDGYKQKWVEHDFPTERLERLRGLVRKRYEQKSSA